MHRSLLAALCAGLPLLTAVGCGGSGPSTPAPVTPQAEAPLVIPPQGDAVPLGHATVRLDADAGTAEVLQDRVNQAIGDAFLVGLTDLAGAQRLFEVRSVEREPTATGARLTLQVAFRHPFALDRRPDLFGWDLKAIVAADRQVVNVPLVGRAATGFEGMAGYTAEWTDQIKAEIPTVGAEVFPYALLGEDPAAVEPFDFRAPAGWNVFPAGGTNEGALAFELTAGEVLDLDIFFTVGYQASATRTTRQSPEYLPPRGNSRAPWRVEGELTTNELSVTPGSLAQLEIRVWDWQHGQGLGSDVTAIRVHAPELMAAPVAATIGGGTGRAEAPLTASATLVNSLGTFPGGDAWALVEVVDELHGANPGGLGGNPGVTLVEDDLVTIGDLQEVRAFQVVRLPVAANLPGADPTAAVTAVPAIVGGTLTISDGTTVQYDASPSSDPDPTGTPEGTIVDYQWDFEWDGVPATFADDIPGVSNDPTQSHTYPAAGTTHLGLRVVDGAGRQSPILDVPITILDQQLVLQLDPVIDLTAWANNRREYGAALVQEPDGPVGIGYTGELGTNYENGYSVWNGSTWSPGSYNYSSGGALEFGWFTKVAPNWLRNNSAHMVSYTQYGTHNPATTTTFGFLAPGFNLDYGIPGYHRYGYDLAINPLTGHIFMFGDWKSSTLSERQLTCWRGGPSEFDMPVFNWPGAGGPTPTVIDSRPSEVSRSRSAWADPNGGIHIAYRAADGSQLRYAYDADGDNLNWNLTDIATGAPGEFRDPAFDLHNGKATIAVDRVTAGSHQLQLFRSFDNGTIWGAPLPVGAPHTAEPTEVSVSVRPLFGQDVVTVGFFTGSPSQLTLRWSPDGGGSWQEVALSSGPAPGDYSGDTLQTRTGGELFAAWSGYDTSNRSNVMARRGIFVLQ
ncbi:MAG TPA: PKD domain-containing protein [bacterium]|nr:PKD domain-containing protein [bacterium]